MESWENVVGYEGVYEVSDKGRIRSAKDKTTKSKMHGVRKWQQRVLKQRDDKHGYKRVNLWKNKMDKTFLVHRLVAEAFIPPVNGKEYINHKDGNPSNNYIDNLEWCDHKENLMHAYENNLNKSPDPIILHNMNTKKLTYFYSKAEASRFLDRNSGYISGLLKVGENKVDEYEIFTRGSELIK